MFKLFITTPLVVAMCSLPVIGQPITPRPTSPQKPPSVQPKDSKEKTTAELGKDAPAFELVDQFGKTHKLESYMGKVVVLEWFNEGCPYCKGVWEQGLVPKLMTELNEKETEVVYLTVNSTANRPEEDVLKSGAEFIEELELETPMLMDYDGVVGRTYGARTTPHMFVIDTEGVLIYSGAISDDHRLKEGDKAETHVLRVIYQLEAGEEVSPNFVEPWGCSVKYKRGKGPGRRGPVGRPGR